MAHARGDMSNLSSGQVPVLVELGGKVNRYLFIGGYLGLAAGGVAGDLKAACGSASCAVASARVGAEIQFHVLPDSFTNPWVGYGIGIESLSAGMSSGGQSSYVTYAGFELANLMGGLDFRISKEFGLGPFVSLSVGRYDTLRRETTGVTTQYGSVSERATHEWFSAGVRGVLFP
jgi:hypothetical protein